MQEIIEEENPCNVKLFLVKINILGRLLNPPASTIVQIAVHDDSINLADFVKLLPEDDQVNINSLLPLLFPKPPEPDLEPLPVEEQQPQ